MSSSFTDLGSINHSTGFDEYSARPATGNFVHGLIDRVSDRGELSSRRRSSTSFYVHPLVQFLSLSLDRSTLLAVYKRLFLVHESTVVSGVDSRPRQWPKVATESKQGILRSVVDDKDVQSVRRSKLEHLKQFFLVDSQGKLVHDELDVTITRHSRERKNL